MANGGSKKRGFITYKSYNFVNKDPLMDLYRTARSDAKMSYQEIREKSGGVSVSTQRNWEHGNTKRCMAATMFAALLCIPGVKGVGFRGGKPYLIR